MISSTVQRILDEYVLRSKDVHGDDLALERVWPLLEALDNPQEKLRVIHLAGTSGKTSTAYFCNALLINAGFVTGMTISPHVDSITERLQIDGKPVSEKEFSEVFIEFYELVRELPNQPSYFELLVAFELWYFAKAKVDYAVIETGMGGLYDATNVLRRKDKVCVITDIGFDHMHVLGNTLAKIATQKAGIIHESNHVFMYRQGDEVMPQIYKRVEEKGAELHVINNQNLKQLDWTKFQQRNYGLAKEVVSFIALRDNFTFHDLAREIVVPARMEEKKLADGSLVIMDGAHNEQKMQTFVTSFQFKYGNKKAPILLALKKGKEYKEVIDALEPIAESCIITTFSLMNNRSFQSQNPTDIKEYCELKGLPAVVIEDMNEALDVLLQKSTKLKIITGSFYLIGQLRKTNKSTLL